MRVFSCRHRVDRARGARRVRDGRRVARLAPPRHGAGPAPRRRASRGASFETDESLRAARPHPHSPGRTDRRVSDRQSRSRCKSRRLLPPRATRDAQRGCLRASEARPEVRRRVRRARARPFRARRAVAGRGGRRTPRCRTDESEIKTSWRATARLAVVTNRLARKATSDGRSAPSGSARGFVNRKENTPKAIVPSRCRKKQAPCPTVSARENRF